SSGHFDYSRAAAEHSSEQFHQSGLRGFVESHALSIVNECIERQASESYTRRHLGLDRFTLLPDCGESLPRGMELARRAVSSRSTSQNFPHLAQTVYVRLRSTAYPRRTDGQVRGAKAAPHLDDLAPIVRRP